MNEQSFPKKKRLLRLNEFIFVFKQSKRIRVIGITLFSRDNKLGYPRIGLAISKRYVKRAHDRNRIKRYARETFRICQNDLSNLDFVFTVHSKDILYLQNNNLIKEFNRLWCHYRCS